MLQILIYHAVSLSIPGSVDRPPWFGIPLNIGSVNTEKYEYMPQPDSMQVGDIPTVVLWYWQQFVLGVYYQFRYL